MVCFACSGSMSTRAWMLLSVFMKKWGLIWYFRYSNCLLRFSRSSSLMRFLSSSDLKKYFTPTLSPSSRSMMMRATESCPPKALGGSLPAGGSLPRGGSLPLSGSLPAGGSLALGGSLPLGGSIPPWKSPAGGAISWGCIDAGLSWGLRLPPAPKPSCVCDAICPFISSGCFWGCSILGRGAFSGLCCGWWGRQVN